MRIEYYSNSISLYSITLYCGDDFYDKVFWFLPYYHQLIIIMDFPVIAKTLRSVDALHNTNKTFQI